MKIIRTINVKQNSAWTASQLTLNLKLHQNLFKEHSPNDIINSQLCTREQIEWQNEYIFIHINHNEKQNRSNEQSLTI